MSTSRTRIARLTAPSKTRAKPHPKEASKRPSADGTRERILDAAERNFAFKGYDGTSVRDIAADAGIQIASIPHHFGPKESLLARVIERRAIIMGDLRLRALERYRAEAKGDPIPLPQLIEGYVWPFIERSSRHGEAWKSYTQLIARLANSRRWGDLISKYYDAVAAQYMKELVKTLPHAHVSAVYNCFHFMVGTMLVACAETGRIERLSKGAVRSRDLESIFQDMLPFLAGGFLAIADKKHLSHHRPE